MRIKVNVAVSPALLTPKWRDVRKFRTGHGVSFIFNEEISAQPVMFLHSNGYLYFLDLRTKNYIQMFKMTGYPSYLTEIITSTILNLNYDVVSDGYCDRTPKKMVLNKGLCERNYVSLYKILKK